MPSSGNLAISITIKNVYTPMPFLGIGKSTMVLLPALLSRAKSQGPRTHPLIEEWRSRATGQRSVGRHILVLNTGERTLLASSEWRPGRVLNIKWATRQPHNKGVPSCMWGLSQFILELGKYGKHRETLTLGCQRSAFQESLERGVGNGNGEEGVWLQVPLTRPASQ